MSVLLSLIILMLAVSGCSVSTQLVVMNLSDKPDEYVVDSHTQTVKVTLAPRTALLMARISGRGVSKAPEQAQYFPLTEIVMRGANGTMMLQGEQVRMSFAEETDQTYSIAYK